MLKYGSIADVNIDEYFDILKKKEVYQYLGDQQSKSMDDVIKIKDSFVKHWAEYNYGVYAVYLADSNRLIGHCGFKVVDDKVELLYAFTPDVWGNGYATESCKYMLTQHPGLSDNLIAYVYPDNIASSCVLKKCGFIYANTTLYNGNKIDIYNYEFTSL